MFAVTIRRVNSGYFALPGFLCHFALKGQPTCLTSNLISQSEWQAYRIRSLNGVAAPDNPDGEPVVTIETKPVPREIQNKLRKDDAQASESSAYIHRPDSTQYHPGTATKAPASTK